MNCVYIPTLAKQVENALTSPGISNKLLSVCQLADVEDWHEASIGSTESKARATIRGIQYETDETYPYFCFVGADIIAQLWRSRNPKAWNIEYKNYHMDELAPEQLIHLNGVFRFELEHTTEGHGFVAWCTPDYITIYNSYGGNVGFYINTYVKKDWVNFFLSFWELTRKEQEDNYHLLWGFTSDMIDFIRELHQKEKMKFIGLTYCKIY